ncbi:MAG: hypothetical protein Q9187_004209, partial [Circinaria calcarea]
MIGLIKLSSLALSTLFFATIHAQTVQFTNSEYPTLPVRKQFNLTWSGDGSGPVTNLIPVRLITKNNPNTTYTWTPSAIIAPGTYALAITQSSTRAFTNYSPRFNITGGDPLPSVTLDVTASFDQGLATTVVGVGVGASSSVEVVVSEILPKGVGLVTSTDTAIGAVPTAPAPVPAALAPALLAGEGEEILSVTARFKSVGALATTIATLDGSRVNVVVSAGQLPPGVGYTTSSKSKSPKSKTPKTNVKPPYPYVTGTGAGAGYACANETSRGTVWLGTPTPTPSPIPSP